MQFTRSWDVALSCCRHATHHIILCISITDASDGQREGGRVTCVFFSMHASNRNRIDRINYMHGINLVPSPRRYFKIAKMENRIAAVLTQAIADTKYSNLVFVWTATIDVDGMCSLAGRMWFSNSTWRISHCCRLSAKFLVPLARRFYIVDDEEMVALAAGHALSLLLLLRRNVCACV